jgi:hypothetical protein
MFAKLVNKNAIKHQKVVPYPKNFHNPYIPSLPGKKPHGPSIWIFKPCASMNSFRSNILKTKINSVLRSKIKVLLWILRGGENCFEDFEIPFLKDRKLSVLRCN